MAVCFVKKRRDEILKNVADNLDNEKIRRIEEVQEEIKPGLKERKDEVKEESVNISKRQTKERKVGANREVTKS